MRKDINCPYSVLNADIICEHKCAKINLLTTTTLHNHDGYELVLFLNGNVSLFIESVEKKLIRGDLVLVPPYAFHGLNLTIDDAANVADYERIVLNIRPSLLQKISDEKTDLYEYMQEETSDKYNIIHIENDVLDEYIDILDNLESATKNPRFGNSLIAKAALTEFLVNLANYSMHSSTTPFTNNMSKIVSDTFELIEENITENITVEMIAAKLHHNTDYIGRTFKRAVGLPIKHYINAKKISLAQQYLRQGYSPSEVCFMVGYENYSSFSRRFSAHIGISPKQYQLNSMETGTN